MREAHTVDGDLEARRTLVYVRNKGEACTSASCPGKKCVVMVVMAVIRSISTDMKLHQQILNIMKFVEYPKFDRLEYGPVQAHRTIYQHNHQSLYQIFCS